MLLGAVSAVQTPRMGALENNKGRMAKFSEKMDPCFIGRNVAVLQCKQFVYTDETTRRRMNNAPTPKPGRFEEEWKKLGLAPIVRIGKADLQEASMILTSVKPEFLVSGKLHTRIVLASFGCEEVKVMRGGEEDQSGGKLVVPKFPDESRNDKQGPSISRKNQKRDDEQGGNSRSEEPMQQDQDQVEGEDDKGLTGGMSSLDFIFLSDFENGTETAGGTTEPAEEGTSTLETPSAFMEIDGNLPESSYPGSSKTLEKLLLMESPRRRRIEGSARVPFLGTLPEGVSEVHHRDHESRTACNMDRVAFMEEVWTVVQCYGTQSMLRTGLNRPLMREILDKLDACEGRLSELLIDSATDVSEASSPVKAIPQEDKYEVVYLSRTRKGTMRPKMVLEMINDRIMKLGSKVTLRKTGKAKKDSEISIKAVNSAKRKRVEEDLDMGQGDDRLPGTDRKLTDVTMVPPILMAGLRSAIYKSKRSDRTLTGVTLEMEILSQCGESTLKDFKPSSMNHGKGSVVGQLIPVEYNRLTVSDNVSIDEPAGGYMKMLEYRNSAGGHLIAL